MNWTSFHWHEALDRVALVQSIFDSEIGKHPTIRRTTKLRVLQEKAAQAIGDLYQEIGAINPHWGK